MNTVTLTIVISLLTVTCSVAGALLAASNLFRSSRKEATTAATTEATSNTRMETKIDNIITGVNDIKFDMRVQGAKIETISERLTRTEEVAKSAHHRLDEHIKE